MTTIGNNTCYYGYIEGDRLFFKKNCLSVRNDENHGKIKRLEVVMENYCVLSLAKEKGTIKAI